MEQHQQMSKEQFDHVATLIEKWLNVYTDEVVTKVLRKVDTLIKNDTFIKLIELLEEEKNKRAQWRVHSIRDAMRGEWNDEREAYATKDYLHTQHVLYELFIKE